MKKILTILLSFVIFSAPASAAVQNFSQLVPEKSITSSGLNCTVNNGGYMVQGDKTSAPINSFFKSNGVFGKNIDDSSLKIQTAKGDFPCDSGLAGGNAQAYFPFLNVDAKTDVMSCGDTLNLSLYFAFTDESSLLWITPFFYSDSQKTQYSTDISLTRDTLTFNGISAVLNEELKYRKWYRFDFIVKTSDDLDNPNTIDIYVDGNLLSEFSDYDANPGAAFPGKQMIFGIEKARIGYRHGSAFADVNSFPNTALYIDDLDINVSSDFTYTEFPQFDFSGCESLNDVLNIIPPEFSAEAFDRYGYSVDSSDTISEKYVSVNDGVKTVYYNMFDSEHLFYADFNGEIYYEQKPSGGFDVAVGGNLEPAVGGRAENDLSFCSSDTAYLSIKTQVPDFNTFMEFSYMPTSDASLLSVIYGNTVSIQDGTLYVNETYVSEVVLNCWNTIDLLMGEKSLIRINGKEILCDSLGANADSIEFRFSGKAAIDDISVMSGSFQPSFDLISLTGENGVLVSAVDKTISIERPMDMSDFKNSINTNADEIYIYDDISCTSDYKSKLFCDKNMVVVLVKNKRIFDFYNVKTMSDGEENITVSLECEDSIYEGQTISATVTGEIGEGDNYAVVYLNGINVAQVDVLPYTDESIQTIQSGSNRLLAVVYNKEGKIVSVSNCAEFNVLPNTAPIVSILSEIPDEMSLEQANTILKEIVISAEDSDGISKVLLYIDGNVSEEKTEVPYCFSIDGLSYGHHTISAVAFDDFGKKSVALKKYTITDKIESNISSVDFEGIDSPNELQNKLLMHCADNGAEMSIANDGISNYGQIKLISTGGGPWAGMDVFSSGNIKIAFDLIFIGASGGFNVSTTMGYEGSDLDRDGCMNFKFSDGTLTLYNGNEINTISYTPGRHSYVYEINTYTKEYNFFADGKMLAQNYKFHSYTDGKDQMREIRFGFNAPKGAFHGIDNLKVSTINEPPYIDSLLFINDTIQSTSAKPGATKIKANISCKIDGRTVTKDNIKLYKDNMPVEISDIELSGSCASFTITPAYDLEGSGNYKIVLSEKLLAASGISSNIGSEFPFTTENTKFDIENIIFKSDGIETDNISGKIMSIEANFINNNENSENAVLIVALRDGTTLKKILSRTVAVATGGGALSISGIDVSELSDPNITVYLIDSWKYRNPIKDKTYTISH